MIDGELIKRCLDREKRAQYELYSKCYSILMGICFRYTVNKEDAEELLNQAFLKILLNLDKYNQDISFIAWIKRVAINVVIDDYRKNKKYKEKEKHFDIIGESTNTRVDYNAAESNLGIEELKKLILQVPPISQRVFNLYVMDGYKHEEIGEMLGISEGTSKWHLSNARRILKDLIAKTLQYDNVRRQGA
jgi:RNA polymerase sigma factor (sigma-70 family)